jgi:hypothetical protein
LSQRKARGRSSKKKRTRGSATSTRVAPLLRRVARELRAYSVPIAAVTSLLGILYLPRWINIGLVLLTATVVFIIRADTTILVAKNLRSKGASSTFVYSIIFLVIIGIVGTGSFLVGKQIGLTSGIRQVLKDLDLPVRPLPPPRPRFPGDLNLDEYCRSQGPYQIMVPGPSGLSVEFEDGPTFVVPYPDDLRRAAERDFGPNNYLICGSRIRQPTPSTGELDQIAFPVDAACKWQYPGQDVKAIPPKDRRDIDQWRCNLASGPPATWP